MSSTEIINPPDLRLLTRNAAAAAMGVSLPTFAVWSKSPDFPKRKRIGKREDYRAEELLQWIVRQPGGGGDDDE